MLSRKISKLKLWSRLGLRSKGGSNTKQHSISRKLLSKYLLPGIPVLSIFALVGIVSYTIGITNFGRSTDSKQKAYAAESTTSTTASGTSSTSASLIVDNNTFYDNIDAEYGTTNYVSHKVTISADNIDGYTLTITGPTNLTAPNGNNATTSDVTKWGYAWGAENATEANLAYNNFTGTTQNLETNTGITNNSVNLTKKLAFAATFTNDASDGHYKGTVGLGLTVTPKQILTFPIETMQEMTPSVCDGVDIGATQQLRDVRDNKSYWVSKMKDGRCWMVQNLDLDIKNSANNANSVANVTNMTPSNTDITTVPSMYQTSTAMPAAQSSRGEETRSWDQGIWVISNPRQTSNCGNSTIGISNCTSSFINVSAMTPSTESNFYEKTSYTGTDGTTSCSKGENSVVSTATSGVCAQYDAHYTIGNYYQWNAAVAGTGSGADVDTGNISNSICPKGWTLPSGSSSVSGSYSDLLSKYSITSSAEGTDDSGVTYNIALQPLFFVRSGYMDNSYCVGCPVARNNQSPTVILADHRTSKSKSTTMLAAASYYSYLMGSGARGLYWSSTPGNYTTSLGLDISYNAVYPASNISINVNGMFPPNRYGGFSVRCVTKY